MLPRIFPIQQYCSFITTIERFYPLPDGQITLNTSADLLIYSTIVPRKKIVGVEMSVYHHQNVLNI